MSGGLTRRQETGVGSVMVGKKGYLMHLDKVRIGMVQGVKCDWLRAGNF